MIYDLENISVRKLYELGTFEFEKYMTLQKCMKSKNIFNNVEADKIGGLKFSEVSELKRIFISTTPEGLFRAFEIVFKCNLHTFMKSDVVSFFYAANWIGEEVNEIFEKEKALASEPDFFMIEAGVKRLEIFEELPTLLSLAKRFGTTPQKVERWKYNLIFAILYYDKIFEDVQKNYNELTKST